MHKGCAFMHLRFIAVEGFYLPRNETAALLQGEFEAVYMLNRDEPMERLARALTSITNDWVAEEWLHVGPPVHVEFEPVQSHLILGHRPVGLRADDTEARYLMNRDDSLDRICASLTATANEYARQEWLHVSALDGLLDSAAR